MAEVARRKVFMSVVLPIYFSLLFFTFAFTLCIYWLNIELSNENYLLTVSVVYIVIAYFILRLFFMKLNYPKTKKDPKFFLIMLGLAIFALFLKCLQVHNLNIAKLSSLSASIQLRSEQYAFIDSPIESFPMNIKNYYLYHRAVKRGYEHNISYMMGGSARNGDWESFLFAEASFYYGGELDFEKAYEQSKYAEKSTEEFIRNFFNNGGYIKRISVDAIKDLERRHEIHLDSSIVQNQRVFAIVNNPKDTLFVMKFFIFIFCFMILLFFYLIAAKQFRTDGI